MKIMMKMYEMVINRYLLLSSLLIFGAFACQKNNTTLTKVVLVSNVDKSEKSPSLDSIVYLYNTIQKNKVYVSQSIHIGNTEETIYYYLHSRENLISLGIETNRDSIIYYPYCSLILHDTIWYDINYLDDKVGFTVFIKDVGLSSKEYNGNLAFLNFVEMPFWVLNKDLKIEKIQSGNLILNKVKEEEILKHPNNYREPVNKSIDVFMPPSKHYFYKSNEY